MFVIFMCFLISFEIINILFFQLNLIVKIDSSITRNYKKYNRIKNNNKSLYLINFTKVENFFSNLIN